MKLDDQTLAGGALRVLGPVKERGAESHDIAAAKIIPGTVDQVARVIRKQDTKLIKSMEMLELHIYLVRALVVIEKIKELVRRPPDLYLVLLIIQHQVINKYRHITSSIHCIFCLNCETSHFLLFEETGYCTSCLKKQQPLTQH